MSIYKLLGHGVAVQFNPIKNNEPHNIMNEYIMNHINYIIIHLNHILHEHLRSLSIFFFFLVFCIDKTNTSSYSLHDSSLSDLSELSRKFFIRLSPADESSSQSTPAVLQPANSCWMQKSERYNHSTGMINHSTQPLRYYPSLSVR